MTVGSPSKITLGIPKGSLESSTLAVFEQVGLQFSGDSRRLWLNSNDSDILPVLLKPQEIPLYVKSGRLDAGLSGRDWIVEQNVTQQIRVLAELPFSRQTARPVRWVLAVPERSSIRTVDDLRLEADERRAVGSPFVISTELIRISRMWLARHGIDANAELSWGATEAKAEYFSDAIIEGTETGSSLKANHLREIAEVFCSTNQFFASRQIYEQNPWKQRKLDGIAHLVRGALAANDLVELRIASTRSIDLSQLIGKGSRVWTTDDPDGGAFRATVTLPRTDVPRVLPLLIAEGASDAWVTPITIYYSSQET